MRFPQLNWRITAVDISHEALNVADAARYTSDYGLGSAHDDLAKQLEARLFDRSGDEWTVVADIRERVSFAYGDVLSADFRQFSNFDLVLGQNFMIHMNDASAETALASLIAAARSGGVLFLGGMDLETKTRLLASHKLVPLDWNIAAIHDEDEHAPLGVAVVLLVLGADQPQSPQLPDEVQHDLLQTLIRRPARSRLFILPPNGRCFYGFKPVGVN